MITHFYCNYFGKSAFKTVFFIEKKLSMITHFIATVLRGWVWCLMPLLTISELYTWQSILLVETEVSGENH